MCIGHTLGHEYQGHGNSGEQVRAHARLKYTIEDHGLDWFRGEVEKLLGYKLEEARPFKFEDTGDRPAFRRLAFPSSRPTQAM